jgi:hypothetical protein
MAASLSWNGTTLRKPAVLDVQLPAPVPSGSPAVFLWREDGSWTKLGGTPEQGTLSLTITEPGIHVVGIASGPGAAPAAVGPLALTPRVFSPTGGFAGDQVAISFTLRAAGSVQVKVFNRAGRLVRRVLDESLGPGVNLVRWDGRDEGGNVVPDGLYIVALRADGELHQKTLSVVR